MSSINYQWKLAQSTDQKRWNELVAQCSGSFYHRFEWSKVYHEGLNYLPTYYFGYHGEKVVGILPVVYRGKVNPYPVSLPLTDIGGILALDKADLTKLYQTALQVNSHIQLYTSDQVKGLEPREGHTLFILDAGNYPVLFEKKYHHKTRNMVRKAERETTVSWETPTSDKVTIFYDLYLKTMRKIGAVALPLKFFQKTAEYFPGESRLIMAKVNGRIGSCLWIFKFEKKIYIWANGSEQNLLSSGANYAVYDQAIKYACQKKYNQIILGASDPDSPQAFFKRRWGAKETPVYIYASPNEQAGSQSRHPSLVKNFIRILPLYLYARFSELAFKFF